MALQEEKYLCTDVTEIPKIVAKCRDNFFDTTPTSLSYRIKQIKGILKFLEECEDELMDALKDYYGGSRSSHFLQRIWLIKYDCYDAIKNIKDWVKPVNKSQPFPLNLMWSAKIQYEPKGVTAVIAPWNYPIGLILRPLIGAIAAGCACILKPSEITNKIGVIFNNKLSNYVDDKLYKVVCGGAKETSQLLKQKLDFVLFTGGCGIGKIIMSACAKQLTPCCLELGGKNPVIVDDDCDLSTTMKRIVFGRWNFNGGQICVAPEYIFISSSLQDEAIDLIKKWLCSFYGSNGNTEESDAYFSVVNNRHFNRLQKVRQYYIDNEASKIAIGGKNDKLFGVDKVNANSRHLPPMLLKDIDFNSDYIMKEEVFGPILSIIPMDGTYNDWKNKIFKLIASKDTPLACYIFSKNQSNISELSLKINAGTVCVNDTVTFMGLRKIPFGGSGASGMGRYAGKYSFDTFSHEKPIAIRSHGTEFLNNDRYPNYDKDIADLNAKLKREAKTLKVYEGLYPKKTPLWKKLLKYSALLGGIVAFAYFVQKYYK